MERARQTIDWQSIERDACSSMPHCASWIGWLSLFIRMHAGELLGELAMYAKRFGTSERGTVRTIGSEFFIQLNGLKFHNGFEYPYPVNAVLGSRLSSPTRKIRDGM